MNILGINDELSSLRNEIRNSGDRGLIAFFIIGFICYQYVPFSSVTGYLAGTLVTSLFVVCAALGGCVYLTYTYYWILKTIFKVWNSVEEKKNEQDIRGEILKKCEEVGKDLKEKDARIKVLEEELEKQRKRMQDPVEKKEEPKDGENCCSHCNGEKTAN